MTIFFLASDNPQPSGGLKFIYRYCELTNEIGYDAAIMHGTSGFQVDKFSHNAPVVFNYSWKKLSRRQVVSQTLRRASERLLAQNKETKVKPDDIVVIPENRLFRAHKIFPGNPKIILNQNPFLAARQGVPKNTKDIIGSLSTSQICQEVSHRLFPDKLAFHLPLWIEREIFTPTQNKKRQIAYMPRRNAEDASMILNLLAASGVTAGIKIVPISNMNLEEVAHTLRESFMFLSFADHEGFGLPAAEAIASGCLTIGYTGIGGDEFFSQFGGWPIAQQDILTFTDTVADTLKSYKRDPRTLDSNRMNNAVAILNHYNRSSAQRALTEALETMFWTQTTDSPKD